MRASKRLLPGRSLAALVLPALLWGCVEPYDPSEDDTRPGTLVINADLAGTAGLQSITISRSDHLMFPVFVPESNCIAELENEQGEKVPFSDAGNGEYITYFRDDFFHSGSEYRLRVVTSEGKVYESSYMELRPSTDIDSVYYMLESVPGAEPGTSTEGIRFHIDFEIDPEASPFMRWELVETYEFHNPDYEGFIYDVDRVIRPIPAAMTDRQCWITGWIAPLFSLYTGNLQGHRYSRYPLHFVSNETQRLKHGYSLLVRQYSLTGDAFRYWDELRKNSQEMGGIYDRQPSLTPGNICNVDDPEERVLGFFSISGVSEKRIFFRQVEGLEVPDGIFCFPMQGDLRLRYIPRTDLPLFLSRATLEGTGTSVFGLTMQECLDCRLLRGSSGEPPEFWPVQ